MESARAATYFDTISKIEGDSAPLEESINALFLFGELLWDASRWLDHTKPYTIELFHSRLDTLMSMHSIILRELGNVNKGLHTNITNAYRTHAEEKANAATK